MKVVEFDGSGLPLKYDPVVLKEFYGARPGAVVKRLIQVDPRPPPPGVN
jgi:hypothetical protein